jgi:hypothetical protein
MAERKKLPLAKYMLLSTYYTLIGDRRKAWDMMLERRQQRMQEKLAKAKPEDRPKIEREILLFKAKQLWLSKPFKEQLAMEKEAKRFKTKDESRKRNR